MNETTQKNVGGYDRGARLVLGPVLVIVGLASFAGLIALGTALAVLALVVGSVLTVTAIAQKCPANSLLGIDTFRENVGRSEEGAKDEPGAKRPS